MLNFIIIVIAICGFAASDSCKKPGVCCNPSFDTCEAVSNTVCPSTGGTCVMSGGSSCVGSNSANALSTTQYTMAQGGGMVSLGVSYSMFYTNSVGTQCTPHLCSLQTAAGAASDCSGSAPTFNYTVSDEGDISVDTANIFGLWVCLKCSTIGDSNIANILKSNNFQITVSTSTCVSSSVLVIRPQLPSTTFSFIIASGVIPESSVIPTFRDDGVNTCSVTSTEIVVSTSSPTTHPDIELNSDSKIVLKDASKKHQEDSITFAIAVTFVNGETGFVEEATGLKDFTFNIACDATSTTITYTGLVTIGTTTYGQDQYYATGAGGKFYIPIATSSLFTTDSSTSCIINSRTTNSADLTAVQFDSANSAYYVQAQDDFTATLISFVLTVAAQGGALSTKNLYFHLGCYSSSTFTDPNTPATINPSVSATPTSVTLHTYSFITSTNSNCLPLSHTTVAEIDSAGLASSPMVSLSCSGSTCSASTILSDRPRTITYSVETEFSDSVTKQTTAFSVVFTCLVADATIVVSEAPSETYSFGQYSTSNKLYFGPYACQISTCCGSMTYTVHDGSNFLPTTLESNSSISFTFPTTTVGMTSYQISINDGNGHTATWVAQITIIDICILESTFVANTALPIGAELTRIESVGGSAALLASCAVQISIKIEVLEDTAFSLDMSQRFISPYCSAADYRITSVTSSQVLSQTVIDSVFQVSTAGVLTFSYSDAVPKNETYSLTMDVFNGNFWSTSSSPLIILEICEYCSGMYSLPEAAPYFIEPLTEEIIINLASATDSYRIPLPEVFDPNGDSWSFRTSGDSSVSVDLNSNSLIVDLHDKNTTSNFTVEIMIIDAKQRTTSYSCMIRMQAHEPSEEESASSVVLPEKPEEADGDDKSTGEKPGPEESSEPQELSPEVTVQITKFSNLGELTLEFSEALNSIPSLAGNLEIYVIPANERHLEERYDPASVNLTWVVERTQENKKVVLQLNFDHPLEISPLIVQDRLIIHFNDSVRPLLFSAATKAPLAEESWILKSPITKQMPISSFTKSFEAGAHSVKVSLKVLLVVTVLLNVLTKGGLIYMLQMIRSLQIVLHFPLLRIVVPANVNMFFAYLIPIVMFDVLDPEWTTELVLNFDEKGQEEISGDILDQMKDLGYETHNSILNMGSLSLFLVAYFVKLGLFVCAAAFSKLTGKGESARQWLRDGLFYGDIIAIVLDSYFEFIISGYLQLQQPLWSFNGEFMAMLVGCLALALALVWYPLAQLNQLSKSREQYLDPDFQDKWGSLLEGISTKARWQRAYFLVFVFRRLLFLAMVVCIERYFEFQIFGVLALNVAYFLYIGQATPHQYLLINNIELINEFLIHFGTIALLLFTDWVPDPFLQYHAGGWSHIVLIALMLFGNLYFVIKSFLWRSRLAFLRLRAQIKSQNRKPLLKRELRKLSSSPESSCEEKQSKEADPCNDLEIDLQDPAPELLALKTKQRSSSSSSSKRERAFKSPGIVNLTLGEVKADLLQETDDPSPLQTPTETRIQVKPKTFGNFRRSGPAREQSLQNAMPEKPLKSRGGPPKKIGKVNKNKRSGIQRYVAQNYGYNLS